jgi:hypothetical protein
LRYPPNLSIWFMYPTDQTLGLQCTASATKNNKNTLHEIFFFFLKKN